MNAIKQAAVTILALITFMFVANKMMWEFQTWECICAHSVCEECNDEWDLYYTEAYDEYASEFDAIFNAIEYKRAKNGRSMVKGINSKSFKFVATGGTK